MNRPSVLEGICVRPTRGAPIEERHRVLVHEESGIEGDYRSGRSARQVTVLAREAWDAACAEVGSELPWTARRANLLVSGVDLTGRQGQTLRIGDVVLEVTGVTRPCNIMDDAKQGLREALEPDERGGVCCRVLLGGTLSVGDPITIEARAKNQERGRLAGSEVKTER